MTLSRFAIAAALSIALGSFGCAGFGSGDSGDGSGSSGDAGSGSSMWPNPTGPATGPASSGSGGADASEPTRPDGASGHGQGSMPEPSGMPSGSSEQDQGEGQGHGGSMPDPTGTVSGAAESSGTTAGGGQVCQVMSNCSQEGEFSGDQCSQMVGFIEEAGCMSELQTLANCVSNSGCDSVEAGGSCVDEEQRVNNCLDSAESVGVDNSSETSTSRTTEDE